MGFLAKDVKASQYKYADKSCYICKGKSAAVRLIQYQYIKQFLSSAIYRLNVLRQTAIELGTSHADHVKPVWQFFQVHLNRTAMNTFLIPTEEKNILEMSVAWFVSASSTLHAALRFIIIMSTQFFLHAAPKNMTGTSVSCTEIVLWNIRRTLVTTRCVQRAQWTKNLGHWKKRNCVGKLRWELKEYLFLWLMPHGSRMNISKNKWRTNAESLSATIKVIMCGLATSVAASHYTWNALRSRNPKTIFVQNVMINHLLNEFHDIEIWEPTSKFKSQH